MRVVNMVGVCGVWSVCVSKNNCKTWFPNGSKMVLGRIEMQPVDIKMCKICPRRLRIRLSRDSLRGFRRNTEKNMPLQSLLLFLIVWVPANVYKSIGITVNVNGVESKHLETDCY